MANRGDLTVALRLQADVAEAKRALDAVDQALTEVEAHDGAQAGAGLDAVTTAATGAARATRDAATAQQQLAGAIDTLDRSKIDAVAAAYAALGTRSESDLLYSIAAQRQAFETLRASGVASASDIARAEAALERQVAAVNAELGRTPAQRQDTNAQAYASLGIQAESDLLYSIAAQRQAFETLRASGVASASDIARAEAALERQVAAVNAELGRTPAPDAVGQAYQTLGLRSTAAVTEEIRTQRAAFDALRASGVASAEDIARAELALQARVATLNAELRRTPDQLRADSKSAAELQFAMRMLPAQITDVVTSLSSGMPAWMVLVQQGGQIKDSFGGIGPAFANITKLITPMRIAVGGAVGAVGALALAYIQAEQEASAFALAIETTGNAAGVTRDKLEAIANQAHEVSGISVGAARDIATGMVQSGRLGSEVIGNLTKSVNLYAKATGQDVDKAAASLAQMFEHPTQGAEKLNQQFHFLSYAQYKYIATLEEQGRKEEAQLELAKRLADHLGHDFVQNLGFLERAWEKMGRAAGDAGEVVKRWFDDPTLEQKIAHQVDLVKQLQEAAGRVPTGSRNAAAIANQLQAAEERLRLLNAQQRGEQDAEQFTKATAAQNEAKIAADKGWETRAKSLQTWREKLAAETAKIREEGKLLGKTQAEIDQQIARATEQLTPKTRTPRTSDPVGNAYASQLQTLTNQLAEARQRLTNAQAGVTGSQDLATTRLEAWLSTNRQALKLDDARVAKLRELAAEIDKAGSATSEQEALNAAAKRAADGMRGIEDDWLAATGRAADAAAAAIEERYRKLREDLQKTGDTAGLAKLDVVVSTEKAKAQLAQLQQDTERVFSAQARGEQSIDAQVSAGLITQLEGQRQLVDLHAQTAKQIEQYLPQLRELANLPGAVGDAARAQLQTLQTQVVQLKATADDLTNAMRNGLQNGLESAVKGLADGTLTLAGAVRTLMASIADAMLQVVTKNLAEMAMDGLMSAFGGAASASTMTAGATEVTTAAGALAAAGTTLIVGAQAIESAAAKLAVANSMSVAGGFADGGYTGPGGVYQIAGIVHAGEFVTRQAVTHQPGAIAFLTDFNARGMAALEGWRGYASGGLVTAPAYSPFRISPASIVQSPGGGSTTVRNAQTFLLVDSPERIASAMQSAAGHEAVTVMLSRDPAKFRSILGINN